MINKLIERDAVVYGSTSTGHADQNQTLSCCQFHFVFVKKKKKIFPGLHLAC